MCQINHCFVVKIPKMQAFDVVNLKPPSNASLLNGHVACGHALG